MTSETENIRARSAPRLQFSLFALLLFVTLACIALAWWQFVFLERQRLLSRRDVIAQKIANANQTIAKKWKSYLDIAKDSERLGSGSAKALMEVETRRLDRLDAELLRMENEALIREGPSASGRESMFRRRIAELKEQRDELQRQVAKRGERSVELETRGREIERLQSVVDNLTQELMKIEIEIETRGLARKSSSKSGR